MVGEITEIVVDVPYDQALYPRDIDYDAALGLAVRKTFVRAFLSDFRDHIDGMRVGDIGCGEALPRDMLHELGIMCEYTGIDKSTVSGCGSHLHINRPDVHWDYKMGPADELMVFDTVLWLRPERFVDIDLIIPFVRENGHLVVQVGGPELDDIVPSGLEPCRNKTYKVTASNPFPDRSYDVTNTFYMWQKK